MGELYLLTGEIHSGKTTALLRWTEKRNDVSGILSPVIKGRRMFMDIATKEIFEMEASDDADVLEVGRYKFSRSSFERASEILLSAIDKKGWLIIDEVGPLELKKQGFYKALHSILDSISNEQNRVLIVRSSKLQEVIDIFHLQGFVPKIISTEFFKAQPV